MARGGKRGGGDELGENSDSRIGIILPDNLTELFDESIVLFSRRALLPQSQVKRVVQQLLIVCSYV